MPLADMSRLVYDNLMKFPLFVMGRIDKNPTKKEKGAVIFGKAMTGT